MITDYTEEILSTMLHKEESKASSLCYTECAGVFTPCDNQSLRTFRLKKGASEFGGKSVFICTKCEETYTS